MGEGDGGGDRVRGQGERGDDWVGGAEGGRKGQGGGPEEGERDKLDGEGAQLTHRCRHDAVLMPLPSGT